MRILGIETSCDETAAAVVRDGVHVLSNVIASAKDAFLWSGGVIPEEAARKQVECVLPVITQTLSEAHITHEDLDAIAVTKGPGLLGSLTVGTVTARILAATWQKPLIGIHHHFGHLSSTWLRQKSEARSTKHETISDFGFRHSAVSSGRIGISDLPCFPILTLTVSGGHTELWLRTAHTSGELLGQTRDDAAGEAFDKGACLLGLPYPGGPAIAKAAENGNPSAFAFPHPLQNEDTLDFSFSGLKTSLKYLLRDLKHEARSTKFETMTKIQMTKKLNHPTDDCLDHSDLKYVDSFRISDFGFRISDIAASYQHAICRHLCDRTMKALAQFPHVKEIHLVGGVSANTHLRKRFQETIGQRSTVNGPQVIRWPVASEFCTDNAAMIAAAAEFLVMERGWPPALFTTDASLSTIDPWSSPSRGISSSSSSSRSS